MSEEDALRKAVEDMVDKAGVDDAVSGDLDLPRIVVTEDKILVFEENDWIEKYAEGVKGDEDEGPVDDDLILTEKGLDNVLENIVGGVDDKVLESFDKVVGSGDFYKAGKDVNEFYDGEVYESGAKESVEDGYVEVEIGVVDELEDKRRGGRSILEVAGFEDEEAERKRKIKRRSTWG